jgi:hypothetical protein
VIAARLRAAGMPVRPAGLHSHQGDWIARLHARPQVELEPVKSDNTGKALLHAVQGMKAGETARGIAFLCTLCVRAPVSCERD